MRACERGALHIQTRRIPLINCDYVNGEGANSFLRFNEFTSVYPYPFLNHNPQVG